MQILSKLGLNHIGVCWELLQPSGGRLMTATPSPFLGCRFMQQITGNVVSRNPKNDLYTQFVLMNGVKVPLGVWPLSIFRFIRKFSPTNRECVPRLSPGLQRKTAGLTELGSFAKTWMAEAGYSRRLDSFILFGVSRV